MITIIVYKNIRIHIFSLHFFLLETIFYTRAHQFNNKNNYGMNNKWIIIENKNRTTMWLCDIYKSNIYLNKY